MEALLAFGVNWKLLLIQGLNFGLLLLVLYKFLYKPLFALLDKRQLAIEKGLKDAEAASHEKEKVMREKDAILASAREEGGRIADGIRKQATQVEKETLCGAQEKSMSLIAEARVKADAEREHLMRESEKDIARMAILAAEKILKEKNEPLATSH
ncbi:MAG: F0F1 ATP synthase subunit B [bacterium]|nr:F0F1 ATP synthase subunit B [bacterium]